MDAEIRFVMTRELGAAADERIRKVRARSMALWWLGRIAFLSVLLVGAFLFIQQLKMSPEMKLAVCAIIGLTITVMVIAKVVTASRRRSRLLAEFGDKEMVYRITDATFEWSMPGASGRYPWQIFVRLCPYPDFWLLFHTKSRAFVLPAELVQGAVGEFIERKVRQSDAGGAPVPVAAGSPPANAADGDDKWIMDRQIKVRLTQDFLTSAALRQLQSLQSLSRCVTWLFAYFGLMFVLMLVILPLSLWTFVMGGLLALLIGMRVVVRVGLRFLVASRVRKVLAKWGEFEATYRITDEGLHVLTPYFNGLISWSKFRKLHRFKDVWLLTTGPKDVHALPSDSLQGEVGEFLIRKIRESDGKVR